MRLYREMILNVSAGMCTVRDGCLGVDSNQRPFRHWSDALTDTGADPELWDGGGGGVRILGGFEF